jgi:hypothetical protein
LASALRRLWNFLLLLGIDPALATTLASDIDNQNHENPTAAAFD